MRKYEQGRAQVQEMARAAERREARRMLSVVIMLATFVAVVFLGGCATTASVKSEVAATEVIGDHQTLRGLVRIAQMGEDCASEQEALREVLAGVFAGAGVPRPQNVEVQPLAGSSYCGFAQGTASEVTMLELGARNTAVAEATIYWSSISAADIRKAQAVLLGMRPLAPRKLGAKLR